MRVLLRQLVMLGLLVAVLACGAPARSQQALPPPPDAAEAPAADDGVSVQTRGPVHEAYAKPLDQKPQPGPVVPKKPPDPITEIPPDQKPEGDNVQWVPGYWAWDDGRNDFLWVSGFWRVVPPGRKWVPGHWQQADGGYQWIAGFWAPASQGEAQYLPPPPNSLDYGPTTPPPDDNSIWSPGSWLYRGDDYRWRPGYWAGAQPGYVWIPDHYCYTPAGYVFVSGYWDYPLADRGMLCAPVAFDRPLWQSPGWAYRPSYCVDLGSQLASLWVRPDCGSYYFGDYYGDRWRGLGYQPWLGWGYRHYDPLYAYNRWHHRDNPDWFRGLREEHLARLHGDLPRLPHTLAEQHAFLRDRAFAGGGRRVVSPVGQFRSGGFRLATVDRQQLLAHQETANRFHAVSHERQALERPGPVAGGRAGPLSLARVPTVPGRDVRAPAGVEHGFGPRAADPFRGGRPPAAFHEPAAVAHEFAPQYRGHPAPAWSPPHAAFAAPPHFAAPAFHSQGHPPPGNFHAGHAPSFAGHGGGHPPSHGGGGHGGGGHGHGGHH